MSSFSNHQQQSRFLANASAAKDHHQTTDTATTKSKQKQPDDESKGTKQNTPSALTPTSSNGPGGLQLLTNPLKYTYVRRFDICDEIWSDDWDDRLVLADGYSGSANSVHRGIKS